MTFTVAEKIQIAMLCDLADPPNKREMDFDFIWRTVMDDDEWALRWKYSGLGLKGENPPEVKLVLDILEMGDRVEEAFEKLNDSDKVRVLAEAYDVPAPRFRGFDGNNETELLHIARLLIDDLDCFSRFKGRDLDAHMPCIESYRRMLAVWRPLWAAKVEQAMSRPDALDLSLEDIVAVLRERIHPEHRQEASDGGRTFDQTKLARR